MENGKKEEKIETVTEEKTITRYDRDEEGMNKGGKVKGKDKKKYFYENGVKGKTNEPPQKRFDLFSMSSYEDSGSLLTKIKEDSREDEEVTEDNMKVTDHQGCSPFPSPNHSREFKRRGTDEMDTRKSKDCFKKKNIAKVQKVIAEDKEEEKEQTGYLGSFRDMMIKRKNLDQSKQRKLDTFSKKETKEISSFSHKSKSNEEKKGFEFPFMKKFDKKKLNQKSKSDISFISQDRKLKKSIVDLKVLQNEEKHPLRKYMDAKYPVVKISKLRKFNSQKENIARSKARNSSIYSSKTARKSNKLRTMKSCLTGERRSKTPNRFDFKSIQANRMSSGYKVSSIRAKSALRKSYKINQDKVRMEPISSGLTVKQVLNNLKINFNQSYQNSTSTLAMPKKGKRKVETPYLNKTYSKYKSSSKK